MAVLLANNVSSTLASDLSIGATSLNVAPGTGAKFPSPTAPDYFYATIVSTIGEVEVVKVTSRVGDVMTVTRAQDSTTAKVFAAGSRIEVRVNAKSVLDAVSDATTPLDARLDTAEADIVALEAADVSLDTRLDAAEASLVTLDGRLDVAEPEIDALQAFDVTLGTSAGSNSVGFLQSGTGATARTTQAKLRERMSVKDFGAVGNGTTNDAPALQAAIDAACAAQVQLFWPKGVYYITATLTVRSKANWLGEGGSYSVVKGDGVISTLVNDDNSNMEDVTVDGLGFDFNGYNTANFGTAMSFNAIGHTRFRIVNTRVFDSAYPGDATTKQRQGLYIGGPNQDIWVLNNDFSAGARIKVGRGGKNVFIKNNKLFYINDNAITMAMIGTAAAPVGDFTENVHIEDNIILNPTGNGIFIGSDGAPATDPAIYLKNVSVSRNIMYYNNTETEGTGSPRFVIFTVPLGGASDVNINDNICVMTSNVLNAGAVEGIRVAGGGAAVTLSRLSIRRNKVYCPYQQTAGIYVGMGGTVDDLIVVDNEINGYSDSIWFANATTYNRVVVSGNTTLNSARGFRISSNPTVTNGVYSRNRVFAPAGPSQFASTNPMTWRVEGNEILNSTAAALELNNTGTKDFYIVGNDFRGSASGPIIFTTSAALSSASARYDNLGDAALITVASAATITVPFARIVSISGTTNIDTITATGRAGWTITLRFDGILTVNDGTGNLRLNGNFTSTADDTLTLACTGTTWVEIARSPN